MAFNTYAQGLKIASDLAQRAVLAESSLSSLAPLASPLPTLQKAFPYYISAAETYSHLIASNLVPDAEKAGIKRKWRLVLERAEKVKNRIEELGGQAGRVGVGDEGEEEAVRRRGGKMNGVDVERWSVPPEREFELKGEGFRAGSQPDLTPQQGVQVEWAESDQKGWEVEIGKGERWVINQGAGADCSVVAGLSVCLEYNRRWGTQLAVENLYPRATSSQARRSDNGKHVLKLLLNGDWRGIVIDNLLPRSSSTQLPLHATSHPLSPTSNPSTSSSTPIGPPWIPLALKAFFLAHGGYSLRGSNPAPDIYAFTGWIPERISLREGFQREKEWDRVYAAWKKGEVLVTLGTGKEAGKRLIPLHAYAVLDVKEQDGERLFEVFDPGLPAEATSTALEDAVEGMHLDAGEPSARRTGLFTITWDEVCIEFDALNLNWNPSLRPVVAKRHWSWAKPNKSGSSPASHPRYRLSVSAASSGTEIWILLSQHIVSKERAFDDIALHVFEEHTARNTTAQLQSMASPYSNAQHVLYRHTLRSGSTSLHITPSRDRGFSRSDFTLHAFGPPDSEMSLERISNTLGFSQSINGVLTSRSAGGHAGWPSYGSNPQYSITIGDPSEPPGKRKGEVRMQVGGDEEGPWNVKLLWSDGGLVYDISEESIVADSGPYAYGLAFAQADSVASGTYTAIVSSFEPGVTGNFTFTCESALPVTIAPVPPEGAGLYHRSIEGKWTETNSGGRPSLNQYHLNPHIDILVPSPLSLQCRLHHPSQSSNVPLNLTLFKRVTGGGMGEQIATSGPYSDTISGVRIQRTRPGVVKQGVYVLVPSGYARGEGRGKSWKVDVWADGPFSLEAGK